jgi:uroporphyrinogen-III synthase
MGANVDAIVVYETRKPGEDQLRELRAVLLGGSVDVLTFTSPSTFRNFVATFSKAELDPLLGRALIAAIGPVTAGAIEEAGYEADCIAPTSTIETLVDAICAKLAERAPDGAIHAAGKSR